MYDLSETTFLFLFKIFYSNHIKNRRTKIRVKNPTCVKEKASCADYNSLPANPCDVAYFTSKILRCFVMSSASKVTFV